MTETTGIITEISSSNNSLYQEDKNKANTLFTVSNHTDQDQIETLPPGSTLNLTQKEANDLKNLHRKRGRIKKDEPNSEKLTKFLGPIHTKYNQDNIKRKIKTHFHAFIIAYLNVEIKKDSNFPSNYRFKKMESKITQDIQITNNKKLLEMPLKEIIANVSKRFKDKEQNAKFMSSIYFKNEKIKELLETKYQTMFNDYYLKSTHKTFENSGEKDESYEEHLDLIKKKDGITYMNRYKENAETFVAFFQKCKERKRKPMNSNDDMSNKYSNSFAVSNDNDNEKDDNLTEKTNINEIKDKKDKKEKHNINNKKRNSLLIIESSAQEILNGNKNKTQIQQNDSKSMLLNHNMTMPALRPPPRLFLDFPPMLPFSFQQRPVPNDFPFLNRPVPYYNNFTQLQRLLIPNRQVPRPPHQGNYFYSY